MTLTEFYPTPRPLVDKMLSDIDFDTISTVLEPSAGKGDIAAIVADRFRQRRAWSDKNFKDGIDCIEIDDGLRHILTGNKYRVVHDDFLTYNSRKRYDLIVMNPPTI